MQPFLLCSPFGKRGEEYSQLAGTSENFSPFFSFKNEVTSSQRGYLADTLSANLSPGVQGKVLHTATGGAVPFNYVFPHPLTYLYGKRVYWKYSDAAIEYCRSAPGLCLWKRNSEFSLNCVCTLFLFFYPLYLCSFLHHVLAMNNNNSIVVQ